MKLNKIFAAFMAVALLGIGFTSCKKEAADNVKLMFNTCSIKVGETFTVKVTAATGEVAWASQDEKIATVKDGVITGVAEGKTVVTATCGTAKATVDVTVANGGTASAPEIKKPEDGKVTLVIKIPAGSECNGIAFKGCTLKDTWTGADQYLNAAGEPVNEGYVTFQAIEGFKDWYQATYAYGKEPIFDDSDVLMAGKFCLVYAGDGSWEGQAIDWEVDEEYTSAAWSLSGDGNLQVQGNGVIYANIGGWQKSECAETPEIKVTLKAPACGCPEEVEIIGSFDGWAGTAMTKVAEGVYEATIKIGKGEKYKFRGAGSWDNQLQELGEDEEGQAVWNDFADLVVEKDGDIVCDYSDPAKYRWTACEE